MKEKKIPEDIIRLVVDGIRKHGSSSKPETDIGHVIWLTDVLSVWDPMFVGMYAPTLKEEEREWLRKTLEKKWKVIEEYEKESLVHRQLTLKVLETRF